MTGEGTTDYMLYDDGDGTYSFRAQPSGTAHDSVTLGTANGLSLSTQELSLAAATNSTPGAATAAQVTKLEGIATGATANSADATLLARANHTGTQPASTISDFDTEVSNNSSVVANTAKISASDETVEDIVGGMLTGNTETNITVTYQDADGTIDFELTGIQALIEAFATLDLSAVDVTLDSTNALDTDITYGTLDTNGDVGTSAGQLAIGNHNHRS